MRYWQHHWKRALGVVVAAALVLAYAGWYNDIKQGLKVEEPWQTPTTQQTTTSTATTTSMTTVTVTSAPVSPKLTTTTLNPTSTTTIPSTTTSTTMGPDEEFEAWVDTEAFLAVVHDAYPDGPDDEAWLELGYRVCDSMASYQGRGWSNDDWLFDQMHTEDGVMYAGVSGAVAATLCSELADWVFNGGASSVAQVCGERGAQPCPSDCSSTCQEYIIDG